MLLARIAASEGFGLFPASFAAIRRDGVTFRPIAEGALLEVRLGCALAEGDLAEYGTLIEEISRTV